MKILPLNYKFNRLPIEISSHFRDMLTETECYVVKKGGQKVASFDFSSTGLVSNLEVKKSFRRKKTSMDALLSIREFIYKRAKEEGLDCIEFYSQGTQRHWYDYLKFWSNPKKNKQLEKLYQHLGANMLEYNPKGSRFVGIIKHAKREEIMEELSLEEIFNTPQSIWDIFKGIFS